MSWTSGHQLIDLAWASPDETGRGTVVLSAGECTLVIGVGPAVREKPVELRELSLELAALLALGPRPVRGRWGLSVDVDVRDLLAAQRARREAVIQRIAAGVPQRIAENLQDNRYVAWRVAGPAESEQPELRILNTPQAVMALDGVGDGMVAAVGDPSYLWRRLNSLIVKSAAHVAAFSAGPTRV